ncbi:MAG: serine/threonine protein kinase [Sandaracinus sp.]|nr:serine/threonine protein kinase [Sandaracinus sp.]MCB9633656.1 serine/threonine protein kinase [Sandaracinus sp.]
MQVALDPNRSAAKRCPTCDAHFRASRQTCAHDGTALVDAAPAAPKDPLLGVELEQTYRLADELGRGGMGTLYLARHRRLRRDVAVKVIHAAFATHELALARFFREAEALARVRSPHVVQVLDALKVPDGRPALVVEHLEGEDLQARLNRDGRMGVDEALALAVELCRGLAAAHAVGVVHRDLKPSNVFLDERAGVAKLIDFGVAHLDGDAALTRTGTVVGTPAYMAPEQVRGSAGVDGRADVYGVGAVLYRCLTGRAPYEGSTPTAVLSKVLEGPPEPPRALAPELPAEAETLVMRAMARDPETRFRSADELAEACKELLRRRASPFPWSGRSTSRALGAGVLATTAAATATLGAAPSHGVWLALAVIAGAVAIGRRWSRTPEHLPERSWALDRALRLGTLTIGVGTLGLGAASAMGIEAPSARAVLAVALTVALATFAIAPWRARASRRPDAA